eukprot:7364798-Pyramimonas_sp.AAC.1
MSSAGGTARHPASAALSAAWRVTAIASTHRACATPPAPGGEQARLPMSVRVASRGPSCCLRAGVA